MSGRSTTLAALALAAVLAAPTASRALAQSGEQTAAPASGETAQFTGVLQSYSGKWCTLAQEKGDRIRFEVEEKSVPGWRKRFKQGQTITVTYRNLGKTRLPLVIAMHLATPAPKAK
jgi:Ni/Co efflux regulator RcnB